MRVVIDGEFFLLCVFLAGLHPMDSLYTGYPSYCLTWFVFHPQGTFFSVQSHLANLNKRLNDLGWFSNKNR